MKNIKKMLLLLLSISIVTAFGAGVKKSASTQCKDKNGKVIKCPVKSSGKKGNTNGSSTKTENRQKERSTSSK